MSRIGFMVQLHRTYKGRPSEKAKSHGRYHLFVVEGHTTFSAHTPAGEKFLGTPKLSVRTSDEDAIRRKAEADGLTIEPTF
jgi:hypothetical protein